MDASSIAVLVSATAAAITGILAQLQHSRCTSLRCCCVDCTRDVSGLGPVNSEESPEAA